MTIGDSHDAPMNHPEPWTIAAGLRLLAEIANADPKTSLLELAREYDGLAERELARRLAGLTQATGHRSERVGAC